MQKTTNYNLNKPEGNDYVNVEVLNENADIIDATMSNLEYAVNNIDFSGIEQDIATVETKVDGVKTVVDATKIKVDTIDTNIETLLNGRVVKGVQRGVVDGSNNVTKYTVTISGVNTTKSLLITNFRPPTNTSTYNVVGELKDSTTIEFTSAASINGLIIIWQVIEFY